METNRNGYTEKQTALIDRFVKENRDGAIVGLSEINNTIVKRSYLERWNASEKKPELPKTDDEYLERIGVIYLFGSRCTDLVRGLCYDETKWDGGLKCRTRCMVVSACFSHPNIDSIWKDVQECCNVALAAAGAAALLSGGAAAIAAFKAAFYGCITVKIGNWAAAIQVDVRTKEDVGNWRWCA